MSERKGYHNCINGGAETDRKAHLKQEGGVYGEN